MVYEQIAVGIRPLSSLHEYTCIGVNDPQCLVYMLLIEKGTKTTFLSILLMGALDSKNTHNTKPWRPLFYKLRQ